MGTKNTLNVPNIEFLTMPLWGNKNGGGKIPPLEYRGVIYSHIYAHIYENHIRWEKLPVGQELPLVQTVMMDSA